MKKTETIYSFLLIGILSVFFAEIFSGASQMWFLEILGIIFLLPLYMIHVTFLIGIALKHNKFSLKSLYFLGIVFGLYEGLITKVLWAGYMNENGPWLGVHFGLAIPESIILTFFWHPILSFIIPILVFEIFSGKIHKTHKQFLTKSKNKNIFIYLFLLIISGFIAFGNSYNIVSANIAYIGTIFLIFIFYLKNKKQDLNIFSFTNKNFKVQFIWLILIYIFGWFVFIPANIPKNILPYIMLIGLYFLAISTFSKSKLEKIDFIETNNKLYNITDLLKFSIFLLICINISSIFGEKSFILNIAGYIPMIIFGIVGFIFTIYQNIKKIN